MRTGAWAHRDFRLIWGGGLVNDTGDWLLMVALPVYVLTETGSGVATALLFIAQLVPAVLLGSVAGSLVDRWNLRRTVVATRARQPHRQVRGCRYRPGRRPGAERRCVTCR